MPLRSVSRHSSIPGRLRATGDRSLAKWAGRLQPTFFVETSLPWTPSAFAAPASTISRASIWRSPGSSGGHHRRVGLGQVVSGLRHPLCRGPTSLCGVPVRLRRQFLQQMEKPDVDSIEGLSPAISIEQKVGLQEPRSTVGTVTEIHDYLRLLFASIGFPTVPAVARRFGRRRCSRWWIAIMDLPARSRLVLYAPFVRGKKGEYRKQLEQMVRRVCPRPHRRRYRRAAGGDSRSRQAQEARHRHRRGSAWWSRMASKNACPLHRDRAEGQRRLIVLAPLGMEEETLSQSYACMDCGTSLAEITPRLFSFNSPYGACPSCSGLGTHMGVDPDRVIADPERAISAGALAPWTGSSKSSWRMRMLNTLAERARLLLWTPRGTSCRLGARGHSHGQR